jgi:hypothetical protein
MAVLTGLAHAAARHRDGGAVPLALHDLDADILIVGTAEAETLTVGADAASTVTPNLARTTRDAGVCPFLGPG